MTLDELLPLAEAAVQQTVDLASSKLGWQLEGSCVFGLYGQAYLGQTFTLVQALEELYDAPLQLFPAVVDIKIYGCLGPKVIVILMPTNHPKVASVEETWNMGLGPFKPVYLSLPRGIISRRLDREQMEKLGEKWVKFGDHFLWAERDRGEPA